MCLKLWGLLALCCRDPSNQRHPNKATRPRASTWLDATVVQYQYSHASSIYVYRTWIQFSSNHPSCLLPDSTGRLRHIGTTHFHEAIEINQEHSLYSNSCPKPETFPALNGRLRFHPIRVLTAGPIKTRKTHKPTRRMDQSLQGELPVLIPLAPVRAFLEPWGMPLQTVP